MFKKMVLVLATFIAACGSDSSPSADLDDIFVSKGANFCGSSTYAACSNNSDCKASGCSSQLCAGVKEGKITICDWQECYDSGKYGLTCGCSANKCQWIDKSPSSTPPPSEIPTLFIHGHGNDIWAWKPMIQKVKGNRFVYENGGGIYAGDAEALSSNSYPKNSIWNFGYYKEKGSELAQYPYATQGKIGGIPITRSLTKYKIIGKTATTDYNSCMTPSMFKKCDLNAPIITNDEDYAKSVAYAMQLKRAVDGILKATGASQINIVAHSMGGLVARAYIKWLGGNTKVNKLLMVGTPNYGVSDLGEHVLQYGLLIGNMGAKPDPLWQRFNEDLEMYPKDTDEFYFDHIPTKLPLFKGHSWIYHLNSDGLLSPTTKIATIAGNYNDFNYGSACFLFICVDQKAFAQWWFSSFSKFTPEPPDDGVVNINEVQIAGAEFNVVVQAAHGRPDAGEAFLGVSNPELLLTENSTVAATIGQWILENDATTSIPPSKVVVELDDTNILLGWANLNGDLDVLEPVFTSEGSVYAIHFGGTDQGKTWVGQIIREIKMHNWSYADYLGVPLKRGPAWRGGVPSLTVIVVDKNGNSVSLHRDTDIYLNWEGGGWRTPVTNTEPMIYDLPIRYEPWVDWTKISTIRIEVRKTVSAAGVWDKEPDDVYMGTVNLVAAWQDTDGDNVYDLTDNCLKLYNPNQYDGNDDGIGDACQPWLSKAFDILLEDAEDISDWGAFGNGLKQFALTSDAKVGQHAMVFGGVDADKTWVGGIEKKLMVNDWTKAPNIKFWAKRGGNVATKGNPSLTFVAIDGTGKEVELFKSNDTYLPWSGGGWRTIIANTNWKEYLLPIKSAAINYADIQKLRIELRRTIYNYSNTWPTDKEPDDVFIDHIRLDPYDPDQPFNLADKDGDGVSDSQDNCPADFNPVQSDWNANTVGDACEIPEPLGPAPVITGVPGSPPLVVPKAYVMRLSQSTVITSEQGLAAVKMSCSGGGQIQGKPAFDPLIAKNFYSFQIQVGPIAVPDLCQISATDTAGQTTSATFQAMPAQ